MCFRICWGSQPTTIGMRRGLFELGQCDDQEAEGDDSNEKPWSIARFPKLSQLSHGETLWLKKRLGPPERGAAGSGKCECQQVLKLFCKGTKGHLLGKGEYINIPKTAEQIIQIGIDTQKSQTFSWHLGAVEADGSQVTNAALVKL